MNSHFERQIILDTETTGMNQSGGAPYIGHRIIEIGAVELLNRRHTGRHFHVYIKPDRLIDAEAIQVHGITDDMLKDKPTFPEIVNSFIEFVQGAELIIHNAPFDVGFINHEFSLLTPSPTKIDQLCPITDSLQMARKLYPGKRNNLDALCDRLGIDNSKRTLHGALLDAQILADVYLAMTGGQTNLFDQLNEHTLQTSFGNSELQKPAFSQALVELPPSEEESLAHQEYLSFIEKKSHGNCLWMKFTTKKSH